MQESEVITRIKYLCKTRNWTIYRLAKQSGITYAQGYHIGRSLALTDFITTHLTPNTQDREDKE